MLALIRLHHADLVKPRLSLQSSYYKNQAQDHMQRVQHQKPKASHGATYFSVMRRSIILVIASFTPYIKRPSLLEQRAGAPPKNPPPTPPLTAL
ncbi:unnamed protein product [Prunus brigantina]